MVVGHAKSEKFKIFPVLSRVEDNLTDVEGEKEDLVVGLYKVYPDTAVLDWVITLKDKDRWVST